MHQLLCTAVLRDLRRPLGPGRLGRRAGGLLSKIRKSLVSGILARSESPGSGEEGPERDRADPGRERERAGAKVLLVGSLDSLEDSVREVVEEAGREGISRIRLSVVGGGLLSYIPHLRKVILEHHPLTIIVEECCPDRVERAISSAERGELVVLLVPKELSWVVDSIASAEVEVRTA